jgi:hypothetical protein
VPELAVLAYIEILLANNSFHPAVMNKGGGNFHREQSDRLYSETFANTAKLLIIAEMNGR